MSTNKGIDPELAQKLSTLNEIPVRNPERAAQGRAAFLAQAEAVAQENRSGLFALQAVSANSKPRHIRWMQKIQSVFHIQQKEHSPMGTFAVIALIFSLVLGGGGVTVAAAQGSMPDQPLYPVKVWSEDMRAGLANGEQAQLELALELADRRAAEIQTMLQAGEVPPDAVQARLQAMIELALRAAVGQSEPQAEAALARIQARLQTQEQAFLHVQAPADPQAEAALLRVRETLRLHLNLCEDGLADPLQLREMLQDRVHQNDGSSVGPGPNEDPGAAGKPDDAGSAGNPWTDGTPTPGSGYGPGPALQNGDYGEGSPYGTGTPQNNSYGPGSNSDPDEKDHGGPNGNNEDAGEPNTVQSGGNTDSGSQSSDNQGGSDSSSDSGSGGSDSSSGGGSGSGSGGGKP